MWKSFIFRITESEKKTSGFEADLSDVCTYQGESYWQPTMFHAFTIELLHDVVFRITFVHVWPPLPACVFEW